VKIIILKVIALMLLLLFKLDAMVLVKPQMFLSLLLLNAVQVEDVLMLKIVTLVLKLLDVHGAFSETKLDVFFPLLTKPIVLVLPLKDHAPLPALDTQIAIHAPNQDALGALLTTKFQLQEFAMSTLILALLVPLNKPPNLNAQSPLEETLVLL